MISSGPGKDILEIHDNLRDQSAARIENSFITIHRDDRGRIWLGSYYNGLIRVVEKDAGPEFIKYDKSSGAPENLVYGLTSDRQGNIWISTVNGLGRFDPETEQFMNYYMSDGLQSSEFIWDASFRDSDGRLYFGGVNGLNAFYPEDIIDNQDLPKVFIDHQQSGSPYRGRIPRKDDPSERHQLYRPDHAQPQGSCFFAGIHRHG